MKFTHAWVHSWACIGEGEDVLQSYGANQGFVIKGERCLVVDSGFHNKTARQVLDRVKSLHSKQLLLVNTHYHSDHVFGNSLFSGAGVAVISQAKCRRMMMRLSPGLLKKYRARDTRLQRLLRNVQVSLPTLTYQDKVTVHLDDEFDVRVYHPETRAHTDGDSMVYVPQDEVVFAGDVLWVGYHPNLEDANIQGQVRALKMILRWNPRKVVPGHGPIGGGAEVRRFIQYLEEFDRNLHALSGEKLSLDEVLRRGIPEWTQSWKLRRLAESHVRKVWNRTGR